MTLNFITKGNNKAVLGTFFPVDKGDLFKFVREYELTWVIV